LSYYNIFIDLTDLYMILLSGCLFIIKSRDILKENKFIMI
jgi:hypothetical protein